MDQGLFRAAGAMAAASRTLDRIAADLANAGTHGHKRSVQTQRFVDVLTDTGTARVPAASVATDFSQGDLQITNAPLHLALQGSGFFVVSSPQGELLTRNGLFSMTEDGALVEEHGWPVATRTNALALDPAGETPVVDASGVVFQGGIEVARLRVVDFEEPQRLQERGQGLWRATPEARERPAEATVRQGALERSNAEPVSALVELIANQRAYELAASTLKQIDQITQRLHQQR